MPTRPCLLCGAVLAEEAQFCSQCGKPDIAAPRARPAAAARWYHNIWFVLAMLFLVLGPFGLPLVWKNPNFSRTVKIVLTLLMVIYTIVLIDMTIRMAQVVSQRVNELNRSLGF